MLPWQPKRVIISDFTKNGIFNKEGIFYANYLLPAWQNMSNFQHTVFIPPLFVECWRALSVAHVRPSVRPCVLPFVHHLGRYFVSATPPTIFSQSFWNFTGVFCQGLKMCMTFGYNPQIKFCHFFHSLNLVNFGLNYYWSLWPLGTLWAQLLLQFYPNPFETLLLFLSRTEDVHDIWI